MPLHAVLNEPHTDYLLYGRIYIPTGKLDALYSTRLSPTWQASVAAISEPPAKGSEPAHTLFNLQHDVGRTCAEYSWSVQDGMFGARVLHNFGKLGAPVDGDHGAAQASATQSTKPKRVDEEDAMEGGLKGRISAGAEAYFSFQEKSGGGKLARLDRFILLLIFFAVSTGIRFTTLPDATPPSFQLPSTPTILSRGAASLLPSQPPTTITATLNPIIGHIQGAYAARVSRDLTLCSRFDFNVYSYESEWTMGAEWWIRRSLSRLGTSVAHDIPPALAPPAPLLDAAHDIHGVVKARASTSNVSVSITFVIPSSDALPLVQDVSLMWEGRIRNLLVSLGVVSNLSSLGKPIKAIGLELSYFSSE